ncbi:MAG: deoxyhypusine synthase [Thermofilum sp. ex4484_15]|nr:MAG: deoxyhypusine synthase [Thermofilum sp. ex4484_15]
MVRKDELLIKEVGRPRLRKNISFKEFFDELRRIGGFTVEALVKASDYLLDMIRDPNVTIFFSFTANLIATGLRSLIADFIRGGFVDVIFTTGGSLDHDIARAFGGKYYVGDFDLDDVMLRDLGIHRLGNILLPMESYGPLIERTTWPLFEKALKRKEEWSIRELIWFLGENLSDENSIIKVASESKVPIYSPGLLDSALGNALFTFNENLRLKGRRGLKLNPLKDLKELSEIVFSSDKIGGLIVGGGISKHHLIWWAQYRGGLEYAIYLTTAVEWDGSLSGARTKEAISWGKIKPNAKRVTVYGDATLTLPLLLYYLYEKCEGERIKRKNKDFGLR